MAYFKTGERGLVVTIAVLSLFAGQFTLDQIPRRTDITNVNTTVCSFVDKTCTNRTLNNVNVSYKGWPLVVSKSYPNPDGLIVTSHNDSIPIPGFGYVSVNGILLALSVIALYVVIKRVQAASYMSDTELSEATNEDGPLISSSQLLNEDGLMSIDKGTIEGFAYNVMSNASGRIMMLINLHGNTHMHVVAIGGNSHLDLPLTESVGSAFLAKTELEGDFPDYFKVYCTPSKQIELRQIFSPDSMETLVDLCRSFDIEIYDETLYMSVSNHSDGQADPPLTEGALTLLKTAGPGLDRVCAEPSQPALTA